MDHKPLFRKIIDAIHALQLRTATIHELADRRSPAWPASVSRTPRHGTAVTPFHAVYAHHFPLSPGMVLRFGDEERTVTRTTHIGGDIGVATWRGAISAEPMRVLPWDWTSHIPIKRQVLPHQQELRRPITIWRGSQRGELYKGKCWLIAEGGVSIRDSEGTILHGDSGAPIFLALEQPVLLGLLGTGTGGSNLAMYWRELLDATDWRVKEAEWDNSPICGPSPA